MVEDELDIGISIFVFVYLIEYRIRFKYFTDIYESYKDLGIIEIEND